MVDESSLKALQPVLKGPSAVIYGGASVVEVAREIVASLKDFPKLEPRAGPRRQALLRR